MRWIFGGILLLLVLGLFVAPLLFGGYYGMMRPYNYYYPHPFFGWFFFPFGFFFLFFIVFGAFRWLFFPWRGRYRHGGWGYRWGEGDEAAEILRQRYAKGEITKEQFDQMMRDLQQNR